MLLTSVSYLQQRRETLIYQIVHCRLSILTMLTVHTIEYTDHFVMPSFVLVISYTLLKNVIHSLIFFRVASQALGQLSRVRLGCLAPLGRPRPVYKSDVECCFVSRNGQMTLKVKVNAFHFHYQLRESQDAYLVQIWWFWLKSVKSYCLDKLKFLEFWIKIFNTSWEYPRMHVWCKFGDSSPNLWRVIMQKSWIS